MWINRLFCTKNDTAKNDTAKTEPDAIIRARELAVRNRERVADTIDQKHVIRQYWNEKE